MNFLRLIYNPKTLNFKSKKREIHTCLVSVFNNLHKNNKLLNKTSNIFNVYPKTGLFEIEELKEPYGFNILRNDALNTSKKLIKEATSPNRSRKMVEIFDELSNSLCKVADLCEFVKNGHPSPNFSIPAEETSMHISAEVEKLNTNQELYKALRDVTTNGDVVETDEVDKYVNSLFLFDMEQSGIHLNEKERSMVVNLNNCIFYHGQNFMNNTLKSVYVKYKDIPKEIQNYFNDEKIIEIYNLNANSDNELVRAISYKYFLNFDESQNKHLVGLLKARKNLATLCGFKSYSHRVLKGSIVENPENVWEFLNLLTKNLKNYAQNDYEVMSNVKNLNKLEKTDLKPWDIHYCTSVYKDEKFSSHISKCAPFFSIGNCMDGLNNIIRSLYNVEFRILKTLDGEVWHKDVIKLAVFDIEKNLTLGYIYCDFFNRQGKSHQDCHFTIQGGCQLPNGKYQTPIVVLVLSLPISNTNFPCLLSPSMVDNLFHEMGHAIHSMLARTKYQHVTGTRCSTDLAEVPSILMEFFASDKRVLKTFAKHYDTKEPIPDYMLEMWIESKKVFSASEIQMQVFYSALDQVFHSENPLCNSTIETLKLIQNEFYGIKHIDGTAWHLRFGHLFGYGGKYYSYLVSKAICSLIWKKLFVRDPLSRNAGLELKNNLLIHGGGKPAKILIENLLKCDVTPKTMSNAIMSELIN